MIPFGRTAQLLKAVRRLEGRWIKNSSRCCKAIIVQTRAGFTCRLSSMGVACISENPPVSFLTGGKEQAGFVKWLALRHAQSQLGINVDIVIPGQPVSGVQ